MAPFLVILKLRQGGKKRLKSRLNSYFRSLVYILLKSLERQAGEREASIYFVLPDVAPMFMWGLWGLKESIFNNIRVWPTHFSPSLFSNCIDGCMSTSLFLLHDDARNVIAVSASCHF